MKQTKSTQAGKKVSPSTSSSKKFKVKITDNFYNEAKELQKKYPRIKEDFMALKDDLKSDPESLGERIAGGYRKIRMTITGKAVGKSGAARVIIDVQLIDRVVYVLSVYDKAEFDTAVTKAIKEMVANGQIKEM